MSKELGLSALQSDPQLFVWHVEGTPRGVAPHAPRAATGHKRRVVILSTHVDDFKGAGEAESRRRLIAGLEKEFSAMKIKEGKFECVGVMHEQNPQTYKIWTHQQHYIPQANEIPVDKKALVPDEHPLTTT